MARVPFTDIEAWMVGKKLKPADAARALGVTSQTFNGWKTRGQVSADASDEVEATIRGNVHAAAIPETSGKHYRVIQQGEAEMGDGAINIDNPEVIRSVDFTEAYIRSVIGYLPKPGRLCLVTGRGDSMEPDIKPGDVVIVDTGCQSFDGDGIYLINSGSGQQIKSLQDRGDAIYVVSANPKYPPFPAAGGMLIGGRAYVRNRLELLG